MLQLPSVPIPKTATGSTSSSGDNTVIAAVTDKFINVYRYKLRTTSTTANTVSAKDDTAGNIIDTDILQAPTAGVFGTNESVPMPSFLFRSALGKPLVLNLSAAQIVVYSLSYFLSDI